MQSDIISEIIEVEDNATKIVEMARVNANHLIASAEVEANQKIKAAVKERRIINNKRLEEVSSNNKEDIKQYEKSLQKTIQVDKSKIDKIAHTLATKICNSSVFDK